MVTVTFGNTEVNAQTYEEEAVLLDVVYSGASSGTASYDDDTKSDSIAAKSGRDAAFFCDWGRVLSDMKHCASHLMFSEWRGSLKDFGKWTLNNNERLAATPRELETLSVIVASGQLPNRELTVTTMYAVARNLAKWMTDYQKAKGQ
jgi:hypothetical protein